MGSSLEQLNRRMAPALAAMKLTGLPEHLSARALTAAASWQRTAASVQPSMVQPLSSAHVPVPYAKIPTLPQR